MRCGRCSTYPWWAAGASPSSPTPRRRHRLTPPRSSRRPSVVRRQGVSVRAVDPGGNVCGPGQEGELQLQGPQSFSGYVDATLDEDAIDASGWFHTGDLGTIDVDGNVRITGRVKDIIIRNAENISVVEVEELLYRHPDVADAAVLGMPDPRTGERVVAVVVPRDGREVELTDIREHCRLQGPRRPEVPRAIGGRRRAAQERDGQGPQARTAITSHVGVWASSEGLRRICSPACYLSFHSLRFCCVKIPGLLGEPERSCRAEGRRFPD